jgi:hydantoinase/carbamoylase family amidase
VRELRVNSDRLAQTIEELASIGAGPKGITRLPLSVEDLQARRYVVALMEEAGLEVSIDPVGNIYGKRMLAADPSLPSVVTGSHICTGSHYGKYDGTVGVLGALEAVRLLNEAGITTSHPIEVAVFTAEEPQRFRAFMPGSRGVAGKLTAKELHGYKDEAGTSLWDALVSAGYHPQDLEQARRTRQTVKAYVELHIEQGRVLEDAGKHIGIVTAIAAPTRFMVTIVGRADHSGATPMKLRKDALCGAAQLVLAVEECGTAEAMHSTVATVGYLTVEPGSMVVVPGKVTLSVDIRSIDSTSKARAAQAVRESIIELSRLRGLEVSTEMIHEAEPAPLSDTVIGTIRQVCEGLGIDVLMMHSGAGHDAQQMASFTDAGMIFVPSVAGISHNPEEYTDLRDIALGTEVLAHVLLQLSGQP